MLTILFYSFTHVVWHITHQVLLFLFKRPLVFFSSPFLERGREARNDGN